MKSLLLVLAITTIQPSFSSEDPGPFVFSYAACKDMTGRANLKAIAYGVGWTKLEAETSALYNVQLNFGCGGRGPIIVESATVTSQKNSNYCVAACVGFDGVDNRYTRGGTGRNLTEAKYSALHETQVAFGCGEIQIVTCQ
ncbi:hypothetical protein SHI21_16785 [Bacteriovorax sp. PP10]|uniref:Uncharacterized protein n=1 Tax=Bacteriovorax antarcticus TaxID=3088717 RepID=A0ABU5VXV2_9BACT|nr:hypothetical protein [Bacteriovorax sp. PP10]MEA9357889.1 hypothetical protein [Bacteriovorax sp. PP10]